MNALGVIWPLADSLICIWHVQKYLRTKACPILARELLRDGVDPTWNEKVKDKWNVAKKVFNSIIYAESKEEKDTA
jgi:hypothetical protein